MKTTLAVVLLASTGAEAFCGFYVAGSGAKLFNDATQVVLMRAGTRTVLAMQNDYRGPPEDFAMVVPVPVVLQKENVRTLPKKVFERVDQVSAPRLVEYWEQDPCPDLSPRGTYGYGSGEGVLGGSVRVEAQFEVGEYEVVILSADDALALDGWLKTNGYQIPEGSEALFRPYVAQGMKFFVAKVNAKKVVFEDGHAALSPLRFHYDSESFALPVRLGLINARDKQDLIVHVLAPDQRYELANLPNVFVPTNIDVRPQTKKDFSSFYAELFDRTLEKNPRAAVTEYAWQATKCDPCPVDPLTQNELLTLGLDVLDPKAPPEPDVQVTNLDQLTAEEKALVKRSTDQLQAQIRSLRSRGKHFSLVHTRLHLRYDKGTLTDDLVFKAAPPVAGGREQFSDEKGVLETGAVPASVNNFQARYAIRYPWKGKVACKEPWFGSWGDPPGENPPESETLTVKKPAFAARKKGTVERLAESPIAELGVKGTKPRAAAGRDVIRQK